jgi:hypothetical protein
MRAFLNAGFGEPVGRTSLRFIKDIGFAGIRQDIPWGAPPEYREELLHELADAGLGAILIIMGNLEYCNGGEIKKLPENWRPSGIQIADYARDVSIQAAGYLKRWYLEIGNEPNLENHGGDLAKDPKRFGRWLHTVSRKVWEAIPDAQIISGGVCGLHRRSLDYLEKALSVFTEPLDERMIIGFHPYRPEKSFEESREDIEENLGRLRGMIDGRRFAVSETGWHSAPQRWGTWPCTHEVQWNDEQIAGFVEWDLDFWQRAGSELYCYFQLNDGPNENDPEHCFGIRDMEGRAKPVADVIRSYIKGARA